MLKRTIFNSGTLGALLAIILVAAPSFAQELAWYQRSPFDADAQENYVVETLLGVNNGLLLGGSVLGESSKLLREYVRLLDGDGQELWRLDIATSGRAAGQSIYSDIPLITPHPRGGWWYVAKYLDSRADERFFIRHLISADGRIISSEEGVGDARLVTPDGTIIELRGAGGLFTWRMIDPAAGTVDSVSFDTESIRSSTGEPLTLSWWETEPDRAFMLFTDPYLGECVLTSVDFRTGRTQSIRLDEVPTVGLDAAVMPDGSVVVLAREPRWREGELHDLVLIRPGIEGGAYDRVRLPLSSELTPTLHGTLSNGDLIYSSSNQIVNNRLYRISPDGSSISYMPFFAVRGWVLSIAPDDALYVTFNGTSNFGKVAGTGITSSVSEDDDPDRQWRELDLSGVD